MKIFKLILPILFLCLGLGTAFAVPPVTTHDNLTVNKTGKGSFKAAVIIPLKIHNIAPSPLFQDIIPEYIKGATYDLYDDAASNFPYCQYTIRGEAGKNVYIKSTSTTITGIIGSGTDKYNAVKTIDGVTIYMFWLVQNGTNKAWDGVSTTPHELKQVDGENFGQNVITIQYKIVQIDPNAPSGLRTFDQSIEVSYGAL